MQGSIVDTRGVRDISPDVLDANGRLKVMPAAYYQGTTPKERALLGHTHAIYGLPTGELIAWLKDQIGNRTAIEIGSGNGVLAEALGIQATDNMMQADPAIKAMYASGGQKVIQYGNNVQKMDALQAVAHHRPQLVVACWVTHKYDEKRHEAGGNMFGVDEEKILDSVETYLFIGNTAVHAGKSLWKRPHDKWEPDWVFSRSINGSKDFVARWDRR